MTKLALRSFRANTIRMVLTVLSVVLAVAFTTGTIIITDAMNRSIDDLFEGSDTDISVVADPAIGSDEKTVSMSTAENVRRVDGVTEVYPMVSASVEVLSPGRNDLVDRAEPQSASAWHDRPDGDIGFHEGQEPQAGDETALREDFAEEAGVNVGDAVSLRVGEDHHRLTVSGTFEASGITGANSGTVALLEAATARELLLGDDSAADRLYVAAEEETGQEELADTIIAEVPGDLTTTPMDQVREDSVGSLRDSVQFLSVILITFAAIALFVGGFLIVNTFSMLVAQRGKEFALLRAVGASRGQVSRVVLGEALLVGIVGAVLGIGVGVVLAGVVMNALGMAGMEIPEVDLVLTPTSIVAGAVLGVLVTTLAAYGPQRRAAKVPPVAALRDSANMAQSPLRKRSVTGTVILVAGGTGIAYGLLFSGPNSMVSVSLGALFFFVGLILIAPFLARPIVGLLSLPFPKITRASGRLARNNAIREPRRTASTALALMIGLGLVAAIGTISESASASVEDQVNRQMGADYIISSQDGTESIEEDFLTDVERVPEVDLLTSVRSSPAQLDGDDTAVISLAAGFSDTIGWEMASGDESPGRDELLISTTLADQNGWGAGEAVDAVFPDGTEETLTVVGVFEQNNLVGADSVLSERGFDHYIEDPLTNIAYATTAQPDEELTDELVELAEDSNATVMDRSTLKESNQELFSERAGLIYGLLGLSILIAALGIANTLTLSTWERTREIGLLRAVGMFRAQVQRMIWLESLVISVFGALLGIGIGVGLAVALQSVLHPLGVTVLAIPYTLLGVLMAMSMIIGIVAAVWPAWRASRVDTLKAISSQ